jgi:hypothetical protein
LRLRGKTNLLPLICALGAIAIAGCASAPKPCNVQPTEVDQARAGYETALRTAEAEKAEIRRLESEIRALKSQNLDEGDIAALENKLAKLKLGSGR